MKQLTVYEAKTRLSSLLDQMSKGATFIITKAGKPIARLSPIESGKRHNFKFGIMKGRVKLAPDFDAPLPEEVIKSFESSAPW